RSWIGTSGPVRSGACGFRLGSMDGQHGRPQSSPRPPGPPPRPAGSPPPPAGQSPVPQQPQRIPVPQPTQAEQEQEREARKAEAKRLHGERVRESTVPSWGGEVRRVLGYSVAAVILACILILAVRWRLLTDNTHETVENTDTWTSIVAMLM